MARCPDCDSLFGHMPTCPSSGKAVATMEREGITPAAGMTEPGKIEEYRRGGADDLPPESLVELRKLRAEFQEAQRRIPRSVGFSVSGSVTSGNLLLVARPGSPSKGRLWHVRGFSVVGGDPVANAGDAAVAHVFVGPQPTSASLGQNAYSWRDKTTTALPVPAFYGDYELVVRTGEHLYFILTGPTASRVYTITGYVKDDLDALTTATETYTV